MQVIRDIKLNFAENIMLYDRTQWINSQAKNGVYEQTYFAILGQLS